MKYDRDAVLMMARSEHVRYIRLQFTDLMGNLKNVEIPTHQLPAVLREGMPFDGSSVDGFARIEESDMLLHPDLDTWLVFPWSDPQSRVARLICDVHLPDGTAFAGDPRGILKRNLKRVEAVCADQLQIGLEVEFFLLRLDKHGHPVLQTNDDGGYFDISPFEAGENCRRDIAIALGSIGIDVEASHHEVAPGQHEIDLKSIDALRAADSLMTLRMLVKTIARAHGLHATFMPKPFANFDGSGLHVHQSLAKRGRNLFFDPTEPLQLTAAARHYAAGLLHHARALTAITNPLVNSYKRIVPGYDAPIYSTWSVVNPNAYVRVPEHEGHSTRIEVRAPDSACNPYLAFAAMLEAGIDGIAREIELPNPADYSLFGMSDMERFQIGVRTLPTTLEEALVSFEENEIIQGVLGARAADLFLRTKWQEWQSYQRAVHAWEHERYLGT